MPNLYLIRHGQAAFMQANYDVLSQKGRVQSQKLGEYLKSKKYQFEACWSGNLQRHLDTLQETESTFGKLPETNIWENLNEHQGAEVYNILLPKILEETQHQGLKKALDSKGSQDKEVRKELLKLFLKSLQLWAKGELELEGYESFRDFKARVGQTFEALQRAMLQIKNGVVFSSGGTIAMLVGLVLGLEDEKVIELNWQIRNTSITELTFGNGKFYLRMLNALPHLEGEWITYV